jgi:HTH-type transcriptional regulator, sugar sensing transcriptional regulator
MSLQDVHKALINIGFSEYEARAYCTLLSNSPANGYEIARRSGIPRAKVYECMDRLVARGAAARVETSNSKAQVFAPADPRILIDNIEHDLKRNLSDVRKELQRHTETPQLVEVFWRITSTEDLITRAQVLADEAGKTLHVGLWSDEFDEVFPMLKNALQRGVLMSLILYSPHPGLKELQQLGAGAILHGSFKKKMVSLAGRQFVLASDCEKCITGSVFPDGKVEGAFTMNRGLVTNALDLVNHEVYVERILVEVGKPVSDLYGEKLEHLRFFDKIKPE